MFQPDWVSGGGGGGSANRPALLLLLLFAATTGLEFSLGFKVSFRIGLDFVWRCCLANAALKRL
jgi:hypothetical protein